MNIQSLADAIETENKGFSHFRDEMDDDAAFVMRVMNSLKLMARVSTSERNALDSAFLEAWNHGVKYERNRKASKV